jgi:hypothetical protein
MDLDCTFYFWKRKATALGVGITATGGVFGVVYAYTPNGVAMALAYGLLVGIFAATSTNLLLSESYCSDNQCLDWGGSAHTTY